MNIFLSYGHDEHVALIKRFISDLEDAGFKVWVDFNDIRSSKDWQHEIEAGITNAEWVIAMMTHHALRRPNGVCLDEISYARMLGKDILPVMIQDVTPPLCIARLQYIDLKQYYNADKSLNEEKYHENLQKIIKYLRREEAILFEGSTTELNKVLLPLNNDIYVHDYNRDFFGRDWFFALYNEWLGKKEQKVFVLAGNAGSGKTAIVAKLCQNYVEIKGVHFCKYNDNERANPKRVIMSLAFHIASQIPEYAEIILKLPDLNSLQEKSVKRLFTYLITEPLHQINQKQEPMVLIIDALDEAEFHQKNDLVNIICDDFLKTPQWLKLFVTTRPEKAIMRKLDRLNPYVLEDSEKLNKEDIKGYFAHHLKTKLQTVHDHNAVVEELLAKSEGNFLYAKQMTNALLEGMFDVHDLSSFPQGLTYMYTAYFERIFSQEECSFKKDIRPILELVVASYEPLPIKRILTILAFDEYDFEDYIEAIHVLFPVKQGVIQPIHKSLIDWLLDREKSGPYSVSAKKGHQLIAAHFWDLYEEGVNDVYLLKYLTKHLINANDVERAVLVLNDEKIIKERIKLFGLDSAIRDYFDELAMLNEVEAKQMHLIFDHDTFQALIVKYQTFLYNSGLYFTLNKLDYFAYFTQQKQDVALSLEVCFTDFLYITERFQEAINKAQLLLNKDQTMDVEYMARLYNVLALSYRKTVEFKESIFYANALQGLGDENDYLYEKSLGLLMKGKIYYHRLQFVESVETIKEAIILLRKAEARALKNDERITYELFCAEYYRVLADALIWDKQYNEAKVALDVAQEIYDRLRVVDRYYVRYIYTKAFMYIMRKNVEEAKLLLSKIKNQLDSHFDLYQVNFFEAIILMKEKEEVVANAIITQGQEHAQAIDAKVEMGQMDVLKGMLEDHALIGNDHPDISKWLFFVRERIEGVLV